MSSYASIKKEYEKSPLAGALGNRIYVNGKWRESDWNPMWDDKRVQKIASKGKLDDDITVFGGEVAPTSKNPDYKWVNTGTFRKPEWEPGGTIGDRSVSRPKSSVQPRWEKIFLGSKAAAAAPTATQQPGAAPVQASPASPIGVPTELAARKDAYERAQQFQAQTASIPRTPFPNDPLDKDFYGGMNAYGRAFVEDYFKGQQSEQRRVELGLAENNFFANDLLTRIDPNKMNISKPDTQKNTLDYLKQLRGLIK